ncbi:oligopeptide transporter [Hypoxylon sp. FL1857]|nr:oligopeptide transporter [Hypoxylon sp. FL1857]
MDSTPGDTRPAARSATDSEVEEGDFQDDRSFTLRALIAGLLIGVLINLTNTYYGLRVGAGSQMSMVSALLGYVSFRTLSRYTAARFTALENVLIVSVATATGCMPLTAGFVGMIPALEYIIGPDENGPLRIGFGNLVLWSIGLCFFGIIFAALFRDHFIKREKLPWPGASATAHLINTLHHRPQKLAPITPDSASSSRESPEDQYRHSMGGESQALLMQVNELGWKAAMNSLLRSSVVSGILSIIMYFIPILHNLPIFGQRASTEWLWNMDLSPGFLGQGIIIGPTIALHMLMGSIVGWGILSPYAKSRGWAPGDVDDWETGSRGWIIWVSLASLFADASVKLSWFIFQPFWRDYVANGFLIDKLLLFWRKGFERRRQSPRPSRNQYTSLAVEGQDDLDMARNGAELQDSNASSWPSHNGDSYSYGVVSSRTLALGFLVSVIICTVAVHVIFHDYIPWFYTLIGIGLSLPMAAVGIRSIAETDYNPESALVSQLAFAVLTSHSDPNAIIINLISAAIAQAGANQSGDLAHDLKVGYLVGARAEAQIQGQVIGSIFGALISCAIYKLYASNYPIPGPIFRVPSSFLVLSTARLVLGRGLPEGVGWFALGAGILSTLATIIKMRYADRWWQKLVPSGVAFAMGIYLMPSFIITRALGGAVYWAYTMKGKARHGDIIIVASGLILGESIASLASVVLTALHVPQVGVRN